jgi:hypothetical protein
MPSEFRNLWAVAASGITCGGGLYYFWVGHSSLALACHGLIAIIIGSTGLFIFWEGRAASVFHAEARSNPDEQT